MRYRQAPPPVAVKPGSVRSKELLNSKALIVERTLAVRWLGHCVGSGLGDAVRQERRAHSGLERDGQVDAVGAVRGLRAGRYQRRVGLGTARV